MYAFTFYYIFFYSYFENIINIENNRLGAIKFFIIQHNKRLTIKTISKNCANMVLGNRIEKLLT